MRSIYWLIFIGLFLTACVTINVYFPAAAAERAADQIIDQVWGKESQPPSSNPAPEKPSNSRLIKDVLQFSGLMRSAVAEANLDISSPAIQAIQDRMTKRHPLLLPHYNSGAIGLTYNGLITLRDLPKVPLKFRNEVKAFVEQENADRLALYQEIANSNRHPEWLEQIQKTFAIRWIERAQSGWWYQDDQNQWQVKS